MYVSIGSAALIGFGLLLLLLPVNALVSSRIGMHRRAMMKYSDQRTKILQQALNGIQLIKSANMENSFKRRMNAEREMS